MKKFDYLVVGSGLYGAIFAHEAKAHIIKFNETVYSSSNSFFCMDIFGGW